ADDLLHLLPHGIQADFERLLRLGRDTLALADEAEQDVLGADVVVLKPPGFFLSQDHNPPGPVAKPLKHRLPPRATEQNLAARPEHRPDGTRSGKPVMVHPHYASAEVRRDRKSARPLGRVWRGTGQKVTFAVACCPSPSSAQNEMPAQKGSLAGR